MNHQKLLEVYHYPDKSRLGRNMDAGYVICLLPGKYDCYITCGIGDEASFDRDFLAKYSYLRKNNSYGFDGTILSYPERFTNQVTFTGKNINGYNDDNNTNLHDLIAKYQNIFLSIDIEGGEYPWILSLTPHQLRRFKQICIEVHGLTGEGFGSPYSDKIKCLEKLSQTHGIFHAHGNNNGDFTNGIPDVLELTYVNKRFSPRKPRLNRIPLPLNGLDYPNNSDKRDYLLWAYPFTSRRLTVIKIGANESNDKIIKTDQIYNQNTKVYFNHTYPDTFSYRFHKNTLTITRTDDMGGWGQDLIGYLV